MKPLSISQLNSQIKVLLESHFVTLMVEGEISNFVSHSSGHLYFSLKDENSNVKCVMFKGNTKSLKFVPQNGMKIIASCALSVYTPRGEYQLMCERLEPAGIGSLKVAFEQLKQKLELKGYFKAELKRPIPKYPKSIALITSATGAALQDMKRVAENRWKLTKFTVFNTLVQGEGAKEQIVKNISLADSLGFDCIVLARGGGSIEDLWAFNEEIVAEAIYAATTPIVSAIGHEIDYLISDFVADMRAPTPSAAMEMILPDGNELSMMLDDAHNLLKNKIEAILQKAATSLTHASQILQAKSPQNKLAIKLQEISILNQSLNASFQNRLRGLESQVQLARQNLSFEIKNTLISKTNELNSLSGRIAQLEPSKNINDAYPLLVKNGKKIQLQKLKKDDEIELQGRDVTAKVVVREIIKVNAG